VIFVIAVLAGLWLVDHGLRHRRSGRKREVWAWAGAAVAFGVAAWSLPNGYVAQKLVASAIMPAGLLFSCGAAVALWLGHRRRRRAWAWAAATVLYGAAGSPWLGELLLFQLEAPYRHVRPIELSVPVVVVLGGGTDRGPQRVQVSKAGDRVVLAAQLLRDGRANLLVTTGSSIPSMGPPRDLTEETLRLWESLGVDPERVVRLPEPKNTSEELRAVAAWARAHRIEQVGLLTSAWHLPRAEALARKQGLDTVALPADFRSDLDAWTWPGPVDLIPSGIGFARVHRAVWEFVGRAAGR
jgi:uncharacterized SAM-binding protein YcdF (DUF218 family)